VDFGAISRPFNLGVMNELGPAVPGCDALTV
jgi:hypothetical protein